MRIFIDKKKLSGGPYHFKSRLIGAFNKIKGIQVIHDDREKFDIELAFIHSRQKHSRRPYVVRIDGCYYMGDTGYNKTIRDSIKNARHVIFQSKFSHLMCRDILKIKPTSFTVVYNGVNQDIISAIKPDKNIHPNSFVACADWRDTKRPKSTLSGFIESKVDAHLYMIGRGIKAQRYRNINNIHILGAKTFEEIISIMKACRYQIHLCYIDSCPNVVVEGLSCGLNVLCTNLGGTKELVQNDGIVLSVDKWRGKVIGKKQFDNLDKSIVAKGINDIISLNKTRPVRPDLDMKVVSNTYLDILRNFL